MKIIFLDHDGVICLLENFGSYEAKYDQWRKENPVWAVSERDRPYYVKHDDFDKECITILNEILEETSSEIVVSSGWRLFGTLEEQSQHYKEQGIIKSPLDYTIDSLYSNLPEEYNKTQEERRIFEIRTYLESHPEVTNWVAIDDMDLSLGNFGLENFVQCKDIRLGLKESGLKEQILNFLR